MKHFPSWRPALLAVFFGAWALAAAPLRAATFETDESYVLPQGATIDDDLYVAANRVVIDGAVNGDLFAVGNLVEINGRVAGSAHMSANFSSLTGAVQGDVMNASNYLYVDGRIGDDLLTATGGPPDAGAAQTYMGWGVEWPVEMSDSLVITPNAAIQGDVLGLAVSAQVAGEAGGDLRFLSANRFSLTETGRVGGDMQVNGGAIINMLGAVARNLDLRAESVLFGPGHEVGGETVYQADAPDQDPAANTQYLGPMQAEEENPNWHLWFWRTFTTLMGFGLLLFLMRWLGQSRRAGGRLLGRDLGFAAFWGFLSLLILPLLILLAPATVWFFFGVPAAVAALVLLIMIVAAAVWIFCPVVAGRSLAPLFQGMLPSEQSRLWSEMAGVVVLVLILRLSRMPLQSPDALTGVLNGLAGVTLIASYVLVVGGWVQARINREAH